MTPTSPHPLYQSGPARASRRVATSVAALTLLASAAFAVGPGVETSGPDVTVSQVESLFSWGQADGFMGYSVGTTSCNIGTVPVNWCDGACGGGLSSAQHPVIAQGIYRLKNGRFEQIGMSWLKHGFLSTNTDEAACKIGTTCSFPPLGGDQLGAGCNDTYWASLNGTRPAGMRSEVDATTGSFPFPHTDVAFTGPYQQHIKVAVGDVDPTQNAGALYYAEGQYVADNDALGGNGLNNATYQPMTVSAGTFDISLTGLGVRERSAIHAWKAADSAVEMHNVDVPGVVVERFEMARKVTQLDVDTWHYEYAIRNMNSDRALRAFSIDFADGTPLSNIGFSDVDSHSGEPYSTTDWTPNGDQPTGTVSWSTETYAVNQNANALRWATMYSFWFDADAPPAGAVHTLTLFKPGSPASVAFLWPIFADGFEAHNFAVWSSLTN